MKINSERLRKRIECINESSRDEMGGYTRLAFSEADRIARHKIRDMMEDACLSVRQDAAGNILGSLLNGHKPSGFIATGSHIDTVQNGGPFDGLLGAVAAIEVLQSIAEQKIALKRPLQAIVFSDEEGSRFGSGLIGSKSIADIPLEAPLDSYVDKNGVSLSDALKDFGINPCSLLNAAVSADTYQAFVELHIEQSIVLEQNKKKIGIVSGIKGPYWIRGSFYGESNHAGGTPMSLRHDALAAAAALAVETNRIANELGYMFVATIGVFNVLPGGINTIPGQVDFTIDIRDLDMERRSFGIAQIEEASQSIAAVYGVSYQLDCIKNSPSKQMDTCIVQTIANVCDEKNVDYMVLPSGAFHDTLSMASVCQVGMIFVPSIDGVSHSPKENTSWEDIYNGADILYDTIVKLANEE